MTTQLTLKDRLLAKIADRTAHVAVIGLGYVGLPLSVEFARGGLRVTGIDVNQAKCAQVNAGQSYVGDVPSATVAELVRAGKLCATSEFSALAEVDAAFICVPTPLSKTQDPDISYIVSAAEALQRYVHPGMLVVLESTTYPGTTEEVLLPRLTAGGLRVGEEVFLAFSPERIDPGNKVWNTRNTPKVLGGQTPACFEVAQALYRVAVDTLVPVSSPATAEMVKILENTFRAVNIGLVNELAQICHRIGIDVWEVIKAARTKPYGYMPFYPGPGLGGHCIPIDPLYLTWKMRGLGMQTRFIELADTINSAMPHWWVSRVQDALNEVDKPLKDSRILILGVAYKQDVDDLRESPALTIMTELLARGAKVTYNDPHVPSLRLDGGLTLQSQPLDAEVLLRADCVLVHTAHSAYDWAWIAQNARLVVDTRNAISRDHAVGIARL